MESMDTPQSLAVAIIPEADTIDLPDTLPPADLLEQLVNLIETDTRRQSTRQAYAADVRAWETWAEQNGVEDPAGRPAHPIWVAAWVADMAHRGNALATIRRRIAGLGADHKARGYADPTTHPIVGAALDKLAKSNTKRQKQARALKRDDIARIVESLDDTTLAGARSAAMILLGWSCALRVGELVNLQVEDIALAGDRLTVQIVGGKARNRDAVDEVTASCDPAGLLCPIDAVRNWIELAGIESGPIFRGLTKHHTIRQTAISARAFGDIIRNAAKAAGVTAWVDVSPHSLRRGWATEAANHGVPANVIKTHGRWSNTATAEKYIDSTGSPDRLAAVRSVITGTPYGEAF